jgi:deoxyribodipyrimidine photo-lyase
MASLDLDLDIESTTGPLVVKKVANPELVLLTIDSMGDADPALVANPHLPVAFVFNKEKLAHLQLSAKRLIFCIETLQDLGSRREVQVYLGSPYDFAAEGPVAVTYAPVLSFNKFENLAEVHPYPWLRLPHSHSLRSFSAWRKKTALILR